MLVVQDAETGEQLFVDTHDRGFRRRFAAAAEEREAELRAAFGDAGVDALELSTDDDLVDAILRFADLRKRRSQLATGGGLPQHLGGRSAMTFLWPEMLWLLLLVPALVAAYFLLLRRKKKSALRYASLAMVKDALRRGRALAPARAAAHVPARASR